MIQLSNLLEISSIYDIYIIDLYGVCFDGKMLFPDALNAIHQLINLNKEILFISNSPRPSHVIKNIILNYKSDSNNLFKNLYTSGDAFAEYVINNNVNNIILIGADKNHPLIEIISQKLLQDNKELIIVDDYKLAKYAVLLAFGENMNSISDVDNLLRSLLEHNIICLCPNPDMVSKLGYDEFLYTQDFYSKRYQLIGGNVLFFGKPNISIYKFALSKLLKLKEEEIILKNGAIFNKKIIAIGDTVVTDIQGAINLSVDSILIGTDTCDEIYPKATYIMETLK